MNPAAELRKRLKASGRDVKSVARAARVPYHKLVRWANGRTRIISLNDAHKVNRALTGRGVTL